MTESSEDNGLKIDLLFVRLMGVLLALMGILPACANVYEIVVNGSNTYYLVLAYGVMAIGGILVLTLNPYPFRKDPSYQEYFHDSLNTMTFSIGLSLLLMYVFEKFLGLEEEDTVLYFIMGIVPIMLAFSSSIRTYNGILITYRVSAVLMIILCAMMIYDMSEPDSTLGFIIPMILFNVLLLIVSFRLKWAIDNYMTVRELASDGSMFTTKSETVSTILLLIFYVAILYLSFTQAMYDFCMYLGDLAQRLFSHDWSSYSLVIQSKAPYFCIVGAVLGLWRGHKFVRGSHDTWCLSIMVSYSLQFMLLACIIPVYLSCLLDSPVCLVGSLVLAYLFRGYIIAFIAYILGFEE